MSKTLTGKMSTFGGPKDLGIAKNENLALVDSDADFQKLKEYFLKVQPPGTTGYGRRLNNKEKFYIACRWNYQETPRKFLQDILVRVTNPANGKSEMAKPIDWGPNADTNRVADLSDCLADALGLVTNDICKVEIPLPGEQDDNTAGNTGEQNMSYSDIIAIPPKDSINTNLHAVTEASMLAKFGRPGELTRDCSDPTGVLEQRIISGVQLTPHIKGRGLKEAIISLGEIFKEVKEANPVLYEQVRSEGILCVRYRKHNPAHYSNHSWGAAIDIYFGQDVVPQGDRKCHRGNLALYPFFHRHGWYWGAEFPGGSVDSMHFELSQEAIDAM